LSSSCLAITLNVWNAIGTFYGRFSLRLASCAVYIARKNKDIRVA